jgi:alpha-beta hydrolase superfamily lysophospholipase
MAVSRWEALGQWGHANARLQAPAWNLRRAAWLLLSAGLAVAAVHLVQTTVIHGLEDIAIETRPMGPQTPAQFGAPFETLEIPGGQGMIEGRLVRAAGARAPAVLVFHGNGEAVSDWAQVQARLYHAGVTSMVFDYGGFGNSPGHPSVAHMREDALAAYAAWQRLTPAADSHVVIGHSLGNAVLLDAARAMLPAPSGIVVHAAFTSARDHAVRVGMVPAWAAPLLPDMWDNEAALSPSGPPILVMHGDRDDVIPVEMGEHLAAAAGHRAHFMRLAGVGHDQLYEAPSEQEWSPILNFVDAVAPGRRADAAHH